MDGYFEPEYYVDKTKAKEQLDILWKKLILELGFKHSNTYVPINRWNNFKMDMNHWMIKFCRKHGYMDFGIKFRDFLDIKFEIRHDDGAFSLKENGTHIFLASTRNGDGISISCYIDEERDMEYIIPLTNDTCENVLHRLENIKGLKARFRDIRLEEIGI